MVHQVIVALLLIATGTRLAAAEVNVLEPVRIAGGLIAGVPNATRSVVAFKGIPYAAPPVGVLRWRAPQPPLPWTGVRQAEHYGASCLQRAPTGKPPYYEAFLAHEPTSEDCLFLNIWAPVKTDASQSAVLVFIHGGMYQTGSGSAPVFDGAALAERGIVVVTLNFRIGVLAGFTHPRQPPDWPEAVAGNFGFLDILAALHWVQDNIAAFGGDPARVTVAGHSTGAHTVHYLTASPAARGLFRGAICISFPYDFLMKLHSLGNVWQTEQEGLAYGQKMHIASLADFRKIPADDLDLTVFTQGIRHHHPAVPEQYVPAFEKGLQNDVPILTGLTANDFSAREQPARLAALGAWAQWRAQFCRTPAYLYLWEQPLPDAQHPAYATAFHGADLPYWFHNLDKFSRRFSAADKLVADRAASYWINFVKTGNPNGAALPAWPAADATRPTMLAIGETITPRPFPPPPATP